jgi:hypothetical protein
MVHYKTVLCFLPLDTNENITVSYDIHYVTCPKCMYYYFRPEARRLEQEFIQKYGN